MEDIFDKVSEATGVPFEDLKEMERQTVMRWASIISTKEITVTTIRDFVISVKRAIENDLVKTNEFEYYFFGLLKRVNRQHIFLKARLQNIMMFESVLEGPAKARQALDSYLKSLPQVKK